MLDIINLVKNALIEQGKTTQVLFEDKVISENTFYKYKQRYPSLKTLVKLSNYLCVSIDYLFELSVENNFLHYDLNSNIFYNNLVTMIKSRNISGRQFCADLNFSRDNLKRWKNGTLPSVETLIEISKYFDCSIDDLLLE